MIWVLRNKELLDRWYTRDILFLNFCHFVKFGMCLFYIVYLIFDSCINVLIILVFSPSKLLYHELIYIKVSHSRVLYLKYHILTIEV